MIDKVKQSYTYVSLFSSAGVGCYGFKEAGFECVATNELIERRLQIQKYNNKCKYDTGYVLGDISDQNVKERLLNEVEKYKSIEKVVDIDVVIATPPCQGMSVANHKKAVDEIIRNSLVIESIRVIQNIHPRVFIFENVPAFMKTICTDSDCVDKPIAEAIYRGLHHAYAYIDRVINFKDYGACSSRSRTLVIGVRRDWLDEVSPWELLPDFVGEKTLREVIGGLPRLNVMGEISKDDIYHAFRKYPAHMRAWIKPLREGESAFDNEDIHLKPHQIIDGQIVINKQKNGDKYRRQYWDKTGPCIHTRNDQLASQNTIHPSDDRVFSIRELMRMMTVPDTFKWSDIDIKELNRMPDEQKTDYLSKKAIIIRQSLGEAVPTIIFASIAVKIKQLFQIHRLNHAEYNKIIMDNNLFKKENLMRFIRDGIGKYSISTLSRIAELANAQRTNTAAYYTNKSLITEIVSRLPDFNTNNLRILEPSAGVGNFIPVLVKRYQDKHLTIDMVDIDSASSDISRMLISNSNLPNNCTINYIVDDFLTHAFKERYDLAIGNPPFLKLKNSDERLGVYLKDAINKHTSNICSFFLDKLTRTADFITLVMPKFILNTPEFKDTRTYLAERSVRTIIDFGENGFKGVLIETIALFIDIQAKPGKTRVVSITEQVEIEQRQQYVTDKQFPYWLLYRNQFFDSVCNKLVFDQFTVFRDRQLTKSLIASEGDIRVLKSRNINDNGTQIVDIQNYDSYISRELAGRLAVNSYLNADNVYIAPNMTYLPRLMPKPKGMLVNGSLAILIPKNGIRLTKAQCLYLSSQEFRDFYHIARNYQTRSLNIDSCSVFFFGVLKKEQLKNTERQPIQRTLFD